MSRAAQPVIVEALNNCKRAHTSSLTLMMQGDHGRLPCASFLTDLLAFTPIGGPKGGTSTATIMDMTSCDHEQSIWQST